MQKNFQRPEHYSIAIFVIPLSADIFMWIVQDSNSNLTLNGFLGTFIVHELVVFVLLINHEN